MSESVSSHSEPDLNVLGVVELDGLIGITVQHPSTLEATRFWVRKAINESDLQIEE